MEREKKETPQKNGLEWEWTVGFGFSYKSTSKNLQLQVYYNFVMKKIYIHFSQLAKAFRDLLH